MEEKKCRNCTFFPCLHPICNIGNKEGCDNFKSIIQKEIENINKKIGDDFGKLNK